jgi:hypothetical protein
MSKKQPPHPFLRDAVQQFLAKEWSQADIKIPEKSGQPLQIRQAINAYRKYVKKLQKQFGYKWLERIDSSHLAKLNRMLDDVGVPSYEPYMMQSIKRPNAFSKSIFKKAIGEPVEKHEYDPSDDIEWYHMGDDITQPHGPDKPLTPDDVIDVYQRAISYPENSTERKELLDRAKRQSQEMESNVRRIITHLLD